MKIRTDFVSNSSSSSYVVAVPKNYTRDEFIKDLVKYCSSNGKDKSFDKQNKAVLDYCLNCKSALFFGELHISDRIYFYIDCPVDDDALNWMAHPTYTKRENGCISWTNDPEIIKKTDSDIVKRIVSYVDTYGNYDTLCGKVDVFKITDDTLKITKLLQDHGCKITYNKNLFDKITKYLSEGASIYSFTIGHEGSPPSHYDYIYIPDIESVVYDDMPGIVLDCECG